MSAQLVTCGMCSHEFLPKAHSGHCPSCGCFKMRVNGRIHYFDVNTGREVTKRNHQFRWNHFAKLLRVELTRVGILVRPNEN